MLSFFLLIIELIQGFEVQSYLFLIIVFLCSLVFTCVGYLKTNFAYLLYFIAQIIWVYFIDDQSGQLTDNLELSQNLGGYGFGFLVAQFQCLIFYSLDNIFIRLLVMAVQFILVYIGVVRSRGNFECMMSYLSMLVLHSVF